VPRSLETAQGNLTAHLHSGLDLTDVLAVSSTTDSSAGDSRVVTQNSTQLQATPVRRLTLSIGSRFYHAGPGVFRTATRARTATVDGRLRLGGGLELSASHTRSGLLPHNDAHTSSTVLGLRWNPSSRLQLSGTYSRTGSSVSGADVGFLRGGEFASGRILVGVTRTVTVIVGASVTDPDSDSRSKQFDALVSKRFGR
jgi:hypothetical protein